MLAPTSENISQAPFYAYTAQALYARLASPTLNTCLLPHAPQSETTNKTLPNTRRNICATKTQPLREQVRYETRRAQGWEVKKQQKYNQGETNTCGIYSKR